MIRRRRQKKNPFFVSDIFSFTLTLKLIQLLNEFSYRKTIVSSKVHFIFNISVAVSLRVNMCECSDMLTLIHSDEVMNKVLTRSSASTTRTEANEWTNEKRQFLSSTTKRTANVSLCHLMFQLVAIRFVLRFYWKCDDDFVWSWLDFTANGIDAIAVVFSLGMCVLVVDK